MDNNKAADSKGGGQSVPPLDGAQGFDPEKVTSYVIDGYDPEDGEKGQCVVVLKSDYDKLLAKLRAALSSPEVERLKAERDYAAKLLGRVCVYGTLSGDERAPSEPDDIDKHAAVDAILHQVKRAEKAESALAQVTRELELLKGSYLTYKEAAEAKLAGVAK